MCITGVQYIFTPQCTNDRSKKVDGRDCASPVAHFQVSKTTYDIMRVYIEGQKAKASASRALQEQTCYMINAPNRRTSAATRRSMPARMSALEGNKPGSTDVPVAAAAPLDDDTLVPESVDVEFELDVEGPFDAAIWPSR